MKMIHVLLCRLINKFLFDVMMRILRVAAHPNLRPWNGTPSDHLVDKAVLAEAVWGDHADQADNFQFVYAQMKNLRRKLVEAGATIGIKAVYGFGYKLISSESE